MLCHTITTSNFFSKCEFGFSLKVVRSKDVRSVYWHPLCVDNHLLALTCYLQSLFVLFSLVCYINRYCCLLHGLWIINKAIRDIYENLEMSYHECSQWLAFQSCISDFTICKLVVQVVVTWLHKKYKGTQSLE